MAQTPSIEDALAVVEERKDDNFNSYDEQENNSQSTGYTVLKVVALNIGVVGATRAAIEGVNSKSQE